MSARRKFWIPLIAVILLACLLPFVPYRSTTSPEWLIQVVDTNGKPVPGLWVRQEWSYFGIDVAPYVESRQTDSQGRVVFPPRVIWASLSSRLLNPQGASEKPGPSVWIEACDDRSLMGEFFWDGNRFALRGPLTQTTRIVVKPAQHCTFT
jgi:hypothetical protein